MGKETLDSYLRRNDLHVRTQNEMMNWARQSKGNRCYNCGRVYDGTYKFVFHHVFEVFKSGNIATFANTTYTKRSMRRFKNEVKKCMFLCMSCHNRHHKKGMKLPIHQWQEEQWPRFLLYEDFGMEKEVA